MRQSKPWTAEEVEKLRKLRAAGASAARASLALKKSVASVKDKAREIGSAFVALRISRRHQREKERIARAKAGLPETPDSSRRR